MSVSIILFVIIIITFFESIYALSPTLNQTLSKSLDCMDLSNFYQEMRKENTTKDDIELILGFIEYSCFNKPIALQTGCGEITGFNKTNFTSNEDKQKWISILENCVENRTELIMTKSEYQNFINSTHEAAKRAEFFGYLTLVVTILGIVFSYPIVNWFKKLRKTH
ncbi:MAG: hypothetical protein QXX85_04800 [Candidatus Nitrosotenuis sp.]